MFVNPNTDISTSLIAMLYSEELMMYPEIEFYIMMHIDIQKVS